MHKVQWHEPGSHRVQFFPYVRVCVCVCICVWERHTQREKGRKAWGLGVVETVWFGLLMYAFMVEFYWRRQKDHVERILTLVLSLPILWNWRSRLGDSDPEFSSLIYKGQFGVNEVSASFSPQTLAPCDRTPHITVFRAHTDCGSE